MPTLSTPTPPGITLDSDATLPHRTPMARTATGISGAVRAAPDMSGVVPGTVPTARGLMSPPAPTPPTSPIPPAERTGTTVVLGKTHLAALAALIVVVGVGVAILAFAALRRNSQPPTTDPAATQQVATAETPATVEPPSATGAAPATPAAGTPPAPTPPPIPTPPKPAAATAPPGATSPTGATPAGATSPAGVAATAGATPPGAKPTGRGTATPTPLDPAAAGRATIESKPAAPEPSAAPAPAPAAPPAMFNEVRVLVNDGERSREREGVLQLSAGQISIAPSGGAAPIVSVPTSALNAVFYSRSKQPRWNDANGKAVESKSIWARWDSCAATATGSCCSRPARR